MDGVTAYKKMADARKSHRRYAGTAPWDEKEEKEDITPVIDRTHFKHEKKSYENYILQYIVSF